MVAVGFGSSALGVNPWADRVVQFSQGASPFPSLNNATRALGEPSRFTIDPPYDSTVNPFSPAYQASQIVSLGAGGSLTLAFDEAITDDPNNAFGIDLLIFGNSGYALDFGSGRATGQFGESDAGVVEVSADGSTWFTIPNARPDNLFPTLGYSDLVDPFDGVPGNVLSDFTKPVDPAFNAIGRTFGQIVAAYNGSGGGTGIDLASVGLSSASFVRISLPASASGNLELDGVSDVTPVPSVGTLGLLLLGAGLSGRRRPSAS